MIGGNIVGTIQQKVVGGFNAIGERVLDWEDVISLTGWLDSSGGDSRYTYGAKLQESSHMFICDYADIDRRPDDKRMTFGTDVYEIMLIDDPMELHQHLEIYLKYVGR